jgi:hypothetical protein
MTWSRAESSDEEEGRQCFPDADDLSSHLWQGVLHVEQVAEADVGPCGDDGGVWQGQAVAVGVLCFCLGNKGGCGGD